MMMLFYLFNGLHWWANFELGIADAWTSTVYNIAMFVTAVMIIGIMLAVGSVVNKKSLIHEFYIEKISEEKQKQAEATAKEAAALAAVTGN